jgi:hypothetical protein
MTRIKTKTLNLLYMVFEKKTSWLKKVENNLLNFPKQTKTKFCN